MKWNNLIPFIAVAIVIAVVAVAASQHTDDRGGSKDFVIIHTGDTHGYIGDDDSSLGFSTAKVLADRYRDQGRAVFMVDVGDFLGGSSMLFASSGEYAIFPMNAVGYDAVTIGNHEFDYTAPTMELKLGLLDMPVICSNLFRPDGEPVFDRYEIVERDGVCLGFFALLTPEINDFSEAIRGDLHVGDPVESAREIVELLKGQNVDAVVMLSHLGIGDEFPSRSDYVCSVVDGIDICINGHSHTPMEHGRFLDSSKTLIPSDTFIADVGCFSEYVGVVSGGSGEFDGILYNGEPLHDPVVDEAVKVAHERAMEAGNERISFTEVDLTGYSEVGGGKENGVGRFCMNTMRCRSDADFSALSVDSFVESLSEGDITIFGALDAVPYAGDLLLAHIMGQELIDYVSKNLAEGGGGSMLEFSDNVRVYTDWTGKEVKAITIDGIELDGSRMYTIQTSTFAMYKLLKLPQDRFITVAGDVKLVLMSTFLLNDPITQELMGGERYVRS